MSTSVQTTYDPVLKIHHAALSPPYAAINVTVHADHFEDPVVLRELFLYHFDVDSNCIEFAFGEKLHEGDEGHYVRYSTDPAVHVPPFRIQIAHQPATADISRYRFTVSWEMLY